jgi:hypothetical protein
VAIQVWILNVGKTMFGLFITQLKIMMNPSLLATPGALSITRISGSVWLKLLGYIAGGSASVWVSILGMLEAVWTMVRFGLVLTSFWVFAQRRAWAVAIGASMYLSYFLMITGHDGCGRYRMMVEPLLLALAAVGAVWIMRIMCGRMAADEVIQESFDEVTF